MHDYNDLQRFMIWLILLTKSYTRLYYNNGAKLAIVNHDCNLNWRKELWWFIPWTLWHN